MAPMDRPAPLQPLTAHQVATIRETSSLLTLGMVGWAVGLTLLVLAVVLVSIALTVVGGAVLVVGALLVGGGVRHRMMTRDETRRVVTRS